MLKQAQSDISVFPTTITKDEYNQVKLHKDDYDDWFVGLVGFCAVFGSKWFGGYARGFKEDKVTPRDMPNEAIRNLIKQAPNLKNTYFDCRDFRTIKSNKVKGYMIYCDPPYLINNAVYQDGKRGFKGWNQQDDIDLMNLLDELNNRGVKFALSNMTESKGVKNEKLIEWSKKYNTVKLNIKYNGSNYQRKTKEEDVEVLITNY